MNVATLGARTRGMFDRVMKLVRARVGNFMIVGGVTALIGMLLLKIFMIVGIQPIAANITELIATLAINYALSRRFTFREAEGRVLWQSFCFFGARIFTLGVSAGTFAVGLSLGVNAQIDNLVGLFVGTIVNYPLSVLIFDAEARMKLRKVLTISRRRRVLHAPIHFDEALELQ